MVDGVFRHSFQDSSREFGGVSRRILGSFLGPMVAMGYVGRKIHVFSRHRVRANK